METRFVCLASHELDSSYKVQDSFFVNPKVSIPKIERFQYVSISRSGSNSLKVSNVARDMICHMFIALRSRGPRQRSGSSNLSFFSR
jgi:hypothetical protein